MPTTKCAECEIEIFYIDTYKCRICNSRYCSKCALKHFGLYEDKEGNVRYKNTIKSMAWILYKRVKDLWQKTKSNF